MQYPLDFGEWIVMKLMGRVHVQTLFDPKVNIPIYAFKCKEHGVQKSRVHGRARLECPECWKQIHDEHHNPNSGINA